MRSDVNLAEELRNLAQKHGVYFKGNLRLLRGEQWNSESFAVIERETLDCGRSVTDRTGPFLCCNVEEAPKEAVIIKERAHQISSDYEGYQCPVTDKWVDGRTAHRENLKRTGCRLMEKGEKEDFVKRRDDGERQMDRDIEIEIRKSVEQLGL